MKFLQTDAKVCEALTAAGDVEAGPLAALSMFARTKPARRSQLPIYPSLQAVLDATPCSHLTFLTTEQGKPFTAAGFGNWFRDRCNEAGLPEGCSAHGLRKAGRVAWQMKEQQRIRSPR